MKLQTAFRYSLSCLVILLTIVLMTPVNAKSPEGIKWYSYKEGVALSKADQKKIFLNFYADWCGYCKKMDADTFQNKSIIGYLNKNFIPIKVNSDKDKQTASQYQVQGLPTTFFLSETGEKIGYRPGYVTPDDMLTLLKYVKSDSYRSMTLEKFAESKSKK